MAEDLKLLMQKFLLLKFSFLWRIFCLQLSLHEIIYFESQIFDAFLNFFHFLNISFSEKSARTQGSTFPLTLNNIRELFTIAIIYIKYLIFRIPLADPKTKHATLLS